MKALSLYIEKWYIIGTVVDDSGQRPLALSNAEERVWLYFYNDVEANCIRYSKAYKGEAMANAMNYYCDIFSLMPSCKEKSYKWYGSDKPMRTIFDNAGLFVDLRKGFDKDEKIPTYLSFSSDIFLESQSVFMELLKDNGFDVKGFVAHIENLAVEYAQRKGRMNSCNHVLVANACNEDLHYMLYRQNEGIFVQIGKSMTLRGKGEDTRKYAIVEQVIDIMNAGSRMLSDQEERMKEHQFLSQYADNWLSMIDRNEANTATPLGSVYFSKQRGNAYPVSVLKSDIDKRTAATVDEIVNEMVKIINDSDVENHEVSHVLLIGDVFDNDEFELNLQKRFAIPAANFVHIHEQELANVVCIYRELSSDMFDSEENAFEKNLKDEIAKVGKERQDKIIELKRSADDAEHRGEYEKALALFEEILELSPSESYFKEKIRILKNLINDNRVKAKSYNEHIAKAKNLFDIKNWEEAIKQCELALKIRPNSEEAIKLLKRINEMKTLYAQLDEYIVKIKTLIEHEDYDAAGKEIDKVSSLGLKDSRLVAFNNILKQAKSRLQEQIRKEAEALTSCMESHKYDDAIGHANELIKIDKENISFWNNKIFEINQERAKEEQRLVKLASLKEQIESAQANEDRENVTLLCGEYLSIEENADIRSIKDLSESRLLIQQQQAIFDEAVQKEDWQKVIDLDSEYPLLHHDSDNARKIKNARRLLSFVRRTKGSHTIEIPIGGGETVPDTSDITHPLRKKPFSKRKTSTSATSESQNEEETVVMPQAKKKYPIPRRVASADNVADTIHYKEDSTPNGNEPKRRKLPRPKKK